MALIRRGAVLAGLIVVAAFGLSACGSSGDSSSTSSGSASTTGSSTSSTSSTSNTASKTADVWVFDDVGGAGTGNQSPIEGAVAAAKSVNAANGIPGYQLVIKRCSTKTDTNVARTCGQQAVADKKAIAVISLSQIGAPVYDPILTQGKLSLIADYGGGDDATSPISFPLDSTVFQTMGALGYAYNNYHMKKIYMVLGDFGTVSDQFVALADGIMKTSTGGVGLIGNTKIPPTATDVSPYVQKALNAHPDAIVAALFESTFISFYRAYKQAGGTAPVFCHGCGGTIAGLGKLANGVMPILTATPATTKSPAVTQYLADLDKYAPKRAGIADASSVAFGWSAVKLLETALKGSQTVDRAATLKKLGELNNASAGLYAPFTTTEPFTGLGGKLPRVFNTTAIIGEAKDGKIYAKTPFFDWYKDQKK